MVREKTSKPKEIFKPYDPDSVPDVMPLPGLVFVRSTKGQDTAVPKLNDHQRSWILDVGVRGEDLASLTGKAATTVYNRVKTDEDAIAGLVAAWKKQHTSTKKPAKEDAEEPEEEDEDGCASCLRGYSKTAWRMVIQKVISNKRNALKLKAKQAAPAQCHYRQPQDDDDQESCHEAPALAKLVGITAYSGRDKFRDDRHDDIHEYSKTLPGPTNAGGKFRKAEALLWAKKDTAFWDAAAAVEDSVNWVQRQKLVATGFEQMIDNLHASRKFRPFVATMLMGWLNEDGQVIFETEAIPDGIVVPEAFRKLNSPLVQQTLNAMYA
ncbi:hypothetical protein B0H17DRAFT_1190500 [Mycena rosella]|uniref:Uncharacterized protein n=1 Tax=Mycena rosella TaxID=1033263 RepID=A0AAD7H3A9_MYCRO|nr:hypothetical protein B0H17DRAFT_1190500 [Mycena rosella]